MSLNMEKKVGQIKKIKVLQFIHGLSMGGAETIVKNYILKLDRTKFEPILLCYEITESPYMEILQNSGIQIINVCNKMPLYGRTGFWAKGINKIMRYFLVKKYIRKLKPDIIHEHLLLNSYLKFAKPTKNTVIFHTQHFQVDRWLKDYYGDVQAAKLLMKHYPMRVIALNETMKREVDTVFQIDNTIVLNNGIDMECFKCTREERTVRQELGIPENAFVIGHVGRFSQVKNHVFLVDVFAEIVKKEPTAYLLMVGKGELLGDIEKKLSLLGLRERTKILSDRTDIPELMGAMDMFVFPSLSEGLGIVLVEAQILGLRCLVSDAVPQEVKFSNLLWYCSLNEKPVKWAEKILGWEECRPLYSDCFDLWDINKVVRNLEKLYEGEVGNEKTKNNGSL